MPIFHMSMLHLLNYSQGVPVSVLHPCKSLEPCADHSKTCLSDELWNTHNYPENMSVSAIHITQTADQQKQIISRFMFKSYTSCQEERLFFVVVVIFKFIMSMFKVIPVPHEYQTWMFYLQKKTPYMDKWWYVQNVNSYSVLTWWLHWSGGERGKDWLVFWKDVFSFQKRWIYWEMDTPAQMFVNRDKHICIFQF